jgi:hypothetical protein
MSIVLAATPASEANTKISGLLIAVYCIMKNILPLIGITLVVLAGVAYGFGQFFGADSRAKAASWGMACLTGAIIMLVIALIGPVIVKGLYTGTVTDIVCP